MSFIPRNQVITVPLHWLKDFYHGYQKSHIFNQLILTDETILTSPASFQEDLQAVLNYFNGKLTDLGLEAYADQTPYPDGIPQGERLDFLYQIYQEIENMVIRVLKLPQPFYTKRTYLPDAIKIAQENGFLFIYDGRKDVYIPNELAPYCSPILPHPVG